MQTRKLIARLKLISVILTVALVLSIGSTAFIAIRDRRIIRELKSGSQDSTGTSDETSEETPDPGADESAAAAEFDGGTVTVGEAKEAYSAIESAYNDLGITDEESIDEAKKEILRSLIEPKILMAKARELGVYDLTDEQKSSIEQQVSEEYEARVSEMMEYRFDDSLTEEQVREDAVSYLKENGYDYDTLLEEATENVWQDNLREYIVKDVQVTEQDIRDYYDKKIETDKIRYAADFSEYDYDRENGLAIVWNPEGVRTVQAILIGFDSDQVRAYLEFQAALENGDSDKLNDIDALYEELKPKAEEVLAKLQAGADFTEMMDEYSVDSNLASEPARSTGYYVSAQSQDFNDSFIEAAMALENIGDISGLVYVDGGIYILRYASDVTPGEVPFEDVRDQLATDCEQEMKDAKYNETVDEWMNEANIVYHTDRF